MKAAARLPKDRRLARELSCLTVRLPRDSEHTTVVGISQERSVILTLLRKGVRFGCADRKSSNEKSRVQVSPFLPGAVAGQSPASEAMWSSGVPA